MQAKFSESYLFRLFLSDRTRRSEEQIRNLRAILDYKFKDQYVLEIIYVIETPELAEREDVLCVPMLIKELPLPARRLVGDFSRIENITVGLELVE
ncbi:MAG TPA: circadian clock KaiB family protein [Thermodesulfovibrionia bacterium]|nr:circadian clock KaiB family protein [Thermodesulfovibrionia bacterium]